MKIKNTIYTILKVKSPTHQFTQFEPRVDTTIDRKLIALAAAVLRKASTAVGTEVKWHREHSSRNFVSTVNTFFSIIVTLLPQLTKNKLKIH